MDADAARRGLEALAVLPFQIGEMTLLKTGFEADVFAVDGPKPLALRIYGSPDVGERAWREFDALGRLHEAGYPVPEVWTFGTEDSPFGLPFVLMERLDGVSLERPYWSGDPGQRQAARRVHYELIARLHRLPPALLGDYPRTVDHEAEGREYLSRLAGHYADGLAPLHAVADWLDTHRERAAPTARCIVHGDFHRNNVLLRDDGAAFVIDWSNVGVGDPRTDLAWTRLIARAHLDDDRGAEDLARYGAPTPHLDWFEAAGCLKMLASDAAAFAFGAAAVGLHPEVDARLREESEFTRTMVDLLAARTGVDMAPFHSFLDAETR